MKLSLCVVLCLAAGAAAAQSQTLQTPQPSQASQILLRLTLADARIRPITPSLEDLFIEKLTGARP